MSELASSAKSELSCDSKWLTSKYLMKHSSKKDLVHRLQNILQALQHDECIEADAPEYPGLAGLCLSLTQFVDHQDKEVRIASVSACMELFTIYAPDAPWDKSDTLKIFRQTVRQLANLAHTTSPKQPNFRFYLRILELLAEVKIAVLLVELHKDGNEIEALDVLAELFRTILHSVRTRHPHEVFEMTQKTISGCLEEYGEGVLIPTALLDELLICVGQGPIVLVTNPLKAAEVAKRHKLGRRTKALPPHQVEQENPSYLVASAIIRKTVDRLSTPIANLLNGLLNTDPRVIAESSLIVSVPGESKLNHPKQQDQSAVANVWNVVYEFHRIAPSILTTVIGTLTNYLTSPELEQRSMVVRLLGRLFCGDDAKIAVKFRSCFREWLRRTNDIDPKIRLTMVEYLLKLTTSIEIDISADAQQSLVKPLTEDSSHLVRLRLIHGLCDVAHGHRDVLRQELWTLVGSRVSAKNKQERKDAVTGLAQNYFTNYAAYHLSSVQVQGDDCPLETVRKVLRTCDQENCADNYSWIPAKVFQAASFGDDIDPDMRNRVFLVMDEVLLGSELPNSSKRLSATARSTGLAILLHTLKQEPVANSYHWVRDLLKQRARLQMATREYLEARRNIKVHPQESEQAMVAHSEALDKLELMACITSGQSQSATGRSAILESFHRAKDKNIFRLLAAISHPSHSNASRSIAFEDLPKMIKNMGEDAVKWVKTLVRRCAMGDFVNMEVVRHCILLADECFQDGDIQCTQKFLECVYLAAESFPDICCTMECFGILIELFVSCRMVSSNKVKRLIIRYGILRTLGAILSRISPHVKPDMMDVARSASQHLFDLCSVDGTPEQARHAVGTISNLYGVEETGRLSQEQADVFAALLESLIAPSKLVFSYNSDCQRLVTTLAALAELALHAPEVFNTPKGMQSVQSAMNLILLCSSKSAKDEEVDISRVSDANQATESSRSKRYSKPKPQMIEAKLSTSSPTDSIVDDSSLSLTCRTYCAAIQFVTSYIRAVLLSHKSQPRDSQEFGGTDLVEQMFHLLTGIILDHGLCKLQKNVPLIGAQERGVLKQCAAVSLLRLCDPRLRLDARHLTTERWHILAGAFLEAERGVREAAMKELSLMLTGNGRYGKFMGNRPMAPLLRLVALVALCVDGDNGLGHSSSNGNAANVGKMTLSIKYHTRECVVALRKAFEATAVQARAKGADAEMVFESKMKVSLMPEFVVLYAFHILSFRPETPVCWSGSSLNSLVANRNSKSAHDENCRRILRKRLKWLFDPLVLSLGESADNISFLLRMTEALGSYQPVVHTTFDSSRRVSIYRPNIETTKSAPAKLKVVCYAAREVLLSYVKKDVHLAVYPGKISLPAHLFQRRHQHHALQYSKKIPGLSGGKEGLSRVPNQIQLVKSPDGGSVSLSSKLHSNEISQFRKLAERTSTLIGACRKASEGSPSTTRNFIRHSRGSKDVQAGGTNESTLSNISRVAIEDERKQNRLEPVRQYLKRSQSTRRLEDSKRRKGVHPMLGARKSTRVLHGYPTSTASVSTEHIGTKKTSLENVDGKENGRNPKIATRRSSRHLTKEQMH